MGATQHRSAQLTTGTEYYSKLGVAADVPLGHVRVLRHTADPVTAMPLCGLQ